ncbi:MAG: hypothetical protein HZA16_14195 [Nitrospirae bacterium]|nr:hypothetical protein [Nitrospirota bacterium]
MTDKHSAGGDIEAWCTKCKLALGHTIIAMVGNSPKRVKCNTCDGEHNYRAGRTEKKVRAASEKAPTRKLKSQEKNYNDYLSRLAGADMTNARKYSIKSDFKKDEVIDHPQFGIGIVVAVIQLNKIDVLFRDSHRLMVQNRE